MKPTSGYSAAKLLCLHIMLIFTDVSCIKITNSDVEELHVKIFIEVLLLLLPRNVHFLTT